VTSSVDETVHAFLCHASEDKPAVRDLYHRLRADGIDVWFDEVNLLPGADWEEDIRAAVRASDVVLVCLTDRAVSKTGFVQREIRYALDVSDEQPEGREFVIPVRLEACEIPSRLRRWQCANLYEADGYARLVSVLRKGPLAPISGSHASGSEPSIPSASPSRSRSRRPIVIAAVVLGIVALSIAASRLGWIRALDSNRAQPDAADVPPGNGAAETTRPVAPPGMVFIPAGTFTMGRDDADDPDERPAHTVSVAAFFIDRHVASDPQTGLPRTLVTWQQARDACAARGARLPSEAEWEYAARGNDGRRYPWGNDFDPDLVNSLEAGRHTVEKVDTRPRAESPFAVANMAGNVWQWCSTLYERYAGPAQPSDVPADARVIRGGSFRSDRRHVTTTTRNFERPDRRSDAIGYRCALSAPR
jgi:formylglycine-generating enzyme required for sulfatase activity